MVWQESGGLSKVIGNNPFNIRNSPLQSGQRTTKNNGKFAVFSSLEKGLQAAAYLLMNGGKGTGKKDIDAYGYRLALNALKVGGNQSAVDFLAALAMSKWDVAHYGATDWLTAFDPKKNHLLNVYTSITGVQLADPTVKKAPDMPQLPRDFNYQVVVRNYLDPYAAGKRYERRRSRGKKMDGIGTRR